MHREILELEWTGPGDLENPYTDLDGEVVFRHASGLEVRRPLFWDGGRSWKARFAAPEAGDWTWSVMPATLTPLTGSFHAEARVSGSLLRLSPGRRTVVQHDGKPLFLVADTAWALPFRATLEQVRHYAADRQRKGFNAAMLMTVNPDAGAEGPDSRTEGQGFARGFSDLVDLRLNHLVPEYFQFHDQQIQILLDHGILPIHTPLFYGFGWKGLRVIGPVAQPDEAARFARYLVARYGAWPALYQVGADGTGWEPAVAAMGEAIEACDAYGQPTGIHYNPWQPNDAHWDQPWCDFHLCQTGHSGEHRPEVMATLHARQPARAVANGEPTYEGMGGGRLGNGVWQSREAWLNLMAGSTLGVWYGAGSLWQWRLDAEEPGWGDWCQGPFGWEGALELEGSNYPGVLARILAEVDWTDMAPRIDLSFGRRSVAVEGRFVLAYVEDGVGVSVKPWQPGLRYTLFCARSGERLEEGELGVPQWEGGGTHVNTPVDRAVAVLVRA